MRLLRICLALVLAVSVTVFPIGGRTGMAAAHGAKNAATVMDHSSMPEASAQTHEDLADAGRHGAGGKDDAASCCWFACYAMSVATEMRVLHRLAFVSARFRFREDRADAFSPDGLQRPPRSTCIG